MDEKDFELLCDLSKTLNLTKTSQNLFTTQSASTKRLQKIEEELGKTLFLRTKRGLIMTPLMEEILPFIDQIAGSLDNVRSIAAAADGEISGTLSIGISSNYARYRLPWVLERFMKQYPKVDIKINAHRSPSLYAELSKGTLHAAIVRGEYNWTDSDIVISEESLCLVVSKEHQDDDLTKLHYITRETDPAHLLDMARWRSENGLAPAVPDLMISDVPTVITMVERGLGWSVLPSICLDSFKGIVKPCFFADGTPFTRKTHLLYREDYYQLPQLRVFIDAVLEDEARRQKAKAEAER